LIVEDLSVKSPQWDPIYELYYRTDMYVSTRAAKVVESQFRGVLYIGTILGVRGGPVSGTEWRLG